jgi:DNA-binding NarL/FixJ family response regulator
MRKIKILIADNQPTARNALRALLFTWDEIEIVGESGDAQSVIAQCAELQPDLVLMDVRMPLLPEDSRSSADLGGLVATQQIKSQWPDISILALTMYGHYREEALAAGADGFLIKGSAPDELTTAIHRLFGSHLANKCVSSS